MKKFGEQAQDANIWGLRVSSGKTALTKQKLVSLNLEEPTSH